MNIANALRLIKPQIVKEVKPPEVNTQTLAKVYKAIENGFNMTKAMIMKVTGLSNTHVSVAVNQLYALRHLSRINVTDKLYAYTAIKPFKGKQS